MFALKADLMVYLREYTVLKHFKKRSKMDQNMR